MIEFFIQALEYEFFRNALIISVLASLACGVIGTYVVIKRMSFISGSIAHSSLGGLGIAYYLGLNPLVGAAVFSVIAALGIGVIRQKAKQRLDTVIGAVWAIGMAIGLLFIFLTSGYTSDLFSYLFGNILLTGIYDLALILVMDIAIIFIVVLMYNAFFAITFDEEYSEVINVPVFPVYLVLLGLVALSVVVLIRAVGIILVIALLTMPAATAERFSANIRKIMVLAGLIGMICMASGVILSYVFNLPAGPLIVLIAALLYLASLKLK